jgi:PAS domain S-box-containing protein
VVASQADATFESGDIEVMTTLARHVALALENARLHEVNERRLGETSVLREIGLALTGLLPLPALLDLVREQLGRLVDVSSMVVMLAGRPPARPRAVLRYRDGVRLESDAPGEIRPLGLSGVIGARREPIRTDSYVDECRRWGVEPVPTCREFTHWLGMPMVVGTDLVGILILRSRHTPFSDHDERMLREVATIVAIAVRDAQRYEELTAARDVLATIAGSREGLVATDLRGRIVYFSAGAETITGDSAAQARERTASQSLLGGRDEATALLDRVKDEGEVRDHPTTIVTRAGSHVDVTLSVLPLRNPAGTMVGTLAILAPRASGQG